MIQYIADEAHYKEIIARVPKVKRSLWIGTADIKDLYVEDRPFLGILADLIKKGKEVRLIHAKEPGPNFREDFGQYPVLVAIGGVAAKDPCFGLGMTPWNEWLGMEIDLPVLDGMPRAEIIAHCLIEMTHLGFEDRVVSKKMVAVLKPRSRRPWLSCFMNARGDDQIWRKLEFLDDDQDQ